MIYDLQDEISRKKARTYFEYLQTKKSRIALIEKRPRRSISQNNYLHLILSAFGINFGYTLQEVKQYIFKETVNYDLFYDCQKEMIDEFDNVLSIPKWRSSAHLDTKELSDAIDRFLDFSAKQGYRLPEPSDLTWITELENEILSNQKYL